MITEKTLEISAAFFFNSKDLAPDDRKFLLNLLAEYTAINGCCEETELFIKRVTEIQEAFLSLMNGTQRISKEMVKAGLDFGLITLEKADRKRQKACVGDHYFFYILDSKDDCELVGRTWEGLNEWPLYEKNKENPKYEECHQYLAKGIEEKARVSLKEAFRLLGKGIKEKSNISMREFVILALGEEDRMVAE